ncbi:MAG: PQQ-dependent sugar dehydrogenase [Erythrobacter sp.]
MTKISKLLALTSPIALTLASCAPVQDVDAAQADASSGSDGEMTVAEHGTFEKGWALAFVPGTDMLAVTQKSGEMFVQNTANKERMTVSGLPEVDFGGQGGLGDVAFLESESADGVGSRTIYMSWVEAGTGGNRGAVVGKGRLNCSNACAVSDMAIIWRQAPKTGKRGHYSHRLLISPDEQHLYIASGDRQELEPAQDTTNNLGTIVRLNMDGSSASGNPMEGDNDPAHEIWSWGHRNILGMDWDASGQLWEIEHGPAGGDELNLVKRAANYGWPTRSNGDHYSGKDIPDHTADDGFTKPVMDWTPVIAPGDMMVYRGDMFAAWKGDALVAGLGSKSLVHVDLDGTKASERARIKLNGNRLRAVTEGPDGAIWVLEDGDGGNLLKLSM